MADLTPKTIGELPSAGTHNGAELLVISQSGDSKKTTIADLVYPVGAIYMSVNSTSPATLFGGTWTQIQDTFLLAAGSTYSAGATGGEASHILTEGEMPSHGGHIYPETSAHWGDAGENTYYMDSSKSGNIEQYSTTRPYVAREGNEIVPRAWSRGSGAAHNNMPPYLAVYVWQRTA